MKKIFLYLPIGADFRRFIPDRRVKNDWSNPLKDLLVLVSLTNE